MQFIAERFLFTAVFIRNSMSIVDKYRIPNEIDDVTDWNDEQMIW